MTNAEQNRTVFKRYLDDRNVEFEMIGLWEYAIYPTQYQRGGGVAHLMKAFDGDTCFIGQRAHNANVWIVELPRIIIDC